MKQIVAVATAALCVSGCGSMLTKVYADPLYSFNHHDKYAVHCEGTEHDMHDCLNYAQKICHGPYNVLGHNGPMDHGDADHNSRLIVAECAAIDPSQH